VSPWAFSAVAFHPRSSSALPRWARWLATNTSRKRLGANPSRWTSVSARETEKATRSQSGTRCSDTNLPQRPPGSRLSVPSLLQRTSDARYRAYSSRVQLVASKANVSAVLPGCGLRVPPGIHHGGSTFHFYVLAAMPLRASRNCRTFASARLNDHVSTKWRRGIAMPPASLTTAQSHLHIDLLLEDRALDVCAQASRHAAISLVIHRMLAGRRAITMG
jgi:hypothetical protein